MQEIEPPGLPTRAALHPTGLYLALCNIKPDELRDAFMQQTVVRVAAAETIVQVPTSALGDAPAWTAPAGLIFHVGRCGSTVLSQALKQHGDYIVYAEPLPINEILAPPHTRSRAELVAALRSLGAAFAAHAGRRYVLKLSSWNTLYCDILAEAFPQTPWVFMVRDPIEVGVGLLSQPSPWFGSTTGPGLHISNAIDPDAQSASKEQLFARLFAAFCDAIARLERARGMLLRYEALAASLRERVLKHFVIAASDEQRRRMEESFGAYAKAPISAPSAFTPDSAAKQAAATPELRAAVDALTLPSLERLEQLFAAGT